MAESERNSSCNEEEGIIQVTADAQESQTTVDKELEQLERAKRFEPFLKENQRLSLETFLPIPTGRRKLSNNSDTQSDSTALAEIIINLQNHVTKHKTHIQQVQMQMLKSMQHADNLAHGLARAVTVTSNQARTISEKQSEVEKLKQQSEQLECYASDIFQTLQSIDKRLKATQDRTGSASFSARWPELDKLLYKRNRPPGA
ncbi:hypothetical protein VTP01DRAFT_3631 [Rhizomucor pusillus]|uniref:uncharacterized protein n=1 Tax=Rhizomucor pusillus TaxID=4840 RepID=UPI0037449658